MEDGAIAVTNDEVVAKSERAASEAASTELAAAMGAYQRGEMAGFEALYAALAGPVRRYLRGLSREPTDDLVQETFLQLHRARRSYLPGQPVRPWVFAIARNVARMRARSYHRHEGHEDGWSEELERVPALTGDGAAIVDQLTLRRALGAVGKDGREALLLHHVLGLSFREVAAVQGTSETAAKVRAHRAAVALRGELSREASR